MTFELDIKYNPNYYKKTNRNNYDKALKEALNKAILYSETESRKRAPIKTGNLRAHHSTHITDDEAQLVNDCGYASYVAFGTSKQQAQNYPLEILKDIQQQKLIPNLIKERLGKEGIV